MSYFLRKIKVNGEESTLIDELFKRFDGMFPGRFAKLFTSPAQLQNWRNVWATAFEDNELTGEDVAVGLRACQSQCQFVPSVGEFIQLCKPALDFENMFVEAKQQLERRFHHQDDTWSSPALYWASVTMSYDILNGSFGTHGKQFKQAYNTAVRKVKSGELSREIPKASKLLAYNAPSFSNKDAARRLSEIMQKVGFKKNDSVFRALSREGENVRGETHNSNLAEGIE